MVPMNGVNTRAEGKMVVKNPRLLQLIALAKEFKVVLSSLETCRMELSHSISTRLVTRVGIDVYQSAAYHVPMFPREAALQIFPDRCKTVDSVAVVTWRLETRGDVVEALAPILRLSERCAGVSRAHQTPSELYIRVIATLLPGITISWVKKSGLDRLYINFMYMLSDESGELHPPKDGERREILMEPEEVREMREQILLDVEEMSKMELPLSAAYYRQLGYDSWAMQTEASAVHASGLLVAGAAAHGVRVQAALVANRKAPMQRLKKREREEFDVEAIVAERSGPKPYLVRWAGYHPSWEAWRVAGVEGDPVETWERRATVANTLALEQWRAPGSGSSSEA